MNTDKKGAGRGFANGGRTEGAGDIVLRDVCLTYGEKEVLKNLNLTLPAGCITALMGRTGSGKTTLLYLLAGLLPPTSGTITGLEGLRLSAVFQQDRLVNSLTVRTNLEAVTGKTVSPREMETLLADFGLTDVMQLPACQLSGGMRRRVALARALLVPFDLLLLDEPFKGLDEDTRRLVMNAMLPRLAGKTVLLITHDEDEAAFWSAPVVKIGE